MDSRYRMTLALVCGLALAGCVNGQGQSEQGGVLIGGVLGGALGSQIGGGRGRTAAIVAGTLMGASIGGSIGRSMDEVDRSNVAMTLETVRTGVPSCWQNPDSRNEYRVVPTRTFESSSGSCREYVIDAVVSGQEQQVYGMACRQADGSWMVQN